MSIWNYSRYATVVESETGKCPYCGDNGWYAYYLPADTPTGDLKPSYPFCTAIVDLGYADCVFDKKALGYVDECLSCGAVLSYFYNDDQRW